MQLLSRDKWQQAVSFSYLARMGTKSNHAIAQNGRQIRCWFFWLCESADNEQIIANWPRNGLGVDQGLELITYLPTLPAAIRRVLSGFDPFSSDPRNQHKTPGNFHAAVRGIFYLKQARSQGGISRPQLERRSYSVTY